MQIVNPPVDLNFREVNEKSVRLQKLRKRSKHCVCRYCGNSLSLRKFTYAAHDKAKIELFCECCNRIEHGIEPEIYKSAKYFVDEMLFDHYPNIDASAQKRRMNIAVVCDILYWNLRNMNLLNEEGFKITLDMNFDAQGEAFMISNTELNIT